MQIARAYGQKPPTRKRTRLGFGMLAALVMSLFGAKNPTRHGAPAPSLEPRAARLEDIERGAISADRYALVTSLWADYAVPSCRVATVWATSAQSGNRGASFSPTLRLSMKTPVRAPAAAAHAATWIAREKLDLEAANDADIAARYVSVEPGASPVVRIFRAARFRPRRAQFSVDKFSAGQGLRLAA
jgi:hypothetical protein